MPSKAVALRLPDHIYAAIDAECLRTDLTKSELILRYIAAGLKVPTVVHTPLEVRVMELEEQLAQHKQCLDGCALEFKSLYRRLDILEDTSEHLEHCLDQDTPEPKPEAIDLKVPEDLAAPEQIGVILSPVSSRDSGGECTSTSELPTLLDVSEFTQFIEPILKPYNTGGYYFRFEDLAVPRSKTLESQANKMGFSSQARKIEGKQTRIWLNQSYCKQAV